MAAEPGSTKRNQKNSEQKPWQNQLVLAEGTTFGDAISFRLMIRALGSDLRAIREVLDRTEGRPARARLDGSGDSAALELSTAKARLVALIEMTDDASTKE